MYPRPGAVLEDVPDDRECNGYEPDDKVDPDGLVQDKQGYTQRKRYHCFIFIRKKAAIGTQGINRPAYAEGSPDYSSSTASFRNHLFS